MSVRNDIRVSFSLCMNHISVGVGSIENVMISTILMRDCAFFASCSSPFQRVLSCVH